MLCNILFLYLLQMLVTGRWILDEPESKIKGHTSSIKYQYFLRVPTSLPRRGHLFRTLSWTRHSSLVPKFVFFWQIYSCKRLGGTIKSDTGCSILIAGIMDYPVSKIQKPASNLFWFRLVRHRLLGRLVQAMNLPAFLRILRPGSQPRTLRPRPWLFAMAGLQYLQPHTDLRYSFPVPCWFR